MDLSFSLSHDISQHIPSIEWGTNSQEYNHIILHILRSMLQCQPNDIGRPLLYWVNVTFLFLMHKIYIRCIDQCTCVMHVGFHIAWFMWPPTSYYLSNSIVLQLLVQLYSELNKSFHVQIIQISYMSLTRCMPTTLIVTLAQKVPLEIHA